MAKKTFIALVIFILFILFITLVSAYQFGTTYNSFTGKLDYFQTENYTGHNLTADFLCLLGDCRNSWPSASGGGISSSIGPYLYDNTTSIFFNETKLNQTIDSRSTGGNVSWNQSLADSLYRKLNIEIGWTNLTNYPVACPYGSAITELNDSVICTDFYNSINWSLFSNNSYYLNGFSSSYFYPYSNPFNFLNTSQNLTNYLLKNESQTFNGNLTVVGSLNVTGTIYAQCIDGIPAQEITWTKSAAIQSNAYQVYITSVSSDQKRGQPIEYTSKLKTFAISQSDGDLATCTTWPVVTLRLNNTVGVMTNISTLTYTNTLGWQYNRTSTATFEVGDQLSVFLTTSSCIVAPAMPQIKVWTTMRC